MHLTLSRSIWLGASYVKVATVVTNQGLNASWNDPWPSVGRAQTQQPHACPHVRHRKGHQGNQAAQAHSCPQPMQGPWIGERWRLMTTLARPQEGKTNGAPSQCCLQVLNQATRLSQHFTCRARPLTLNVA